MANNDVSNTSEPQPAWQPAAQPAPAAPRGGVKWPVIILGLLAVCLCLIAGAAAFVALDPMKLHIVERLAGRYDPVARAIPADAPVAAQLDLLALANERTDRLLAAFADMPGAEDAGSVDEVISRLDESLNKELGLTFTDDVKPWLGQYAGLAITEVPLPGTNRGQAPGGRAAGLALASGAQDVKFALVVETRDQAKSDAFVKKLVDGAEKNTGKPAATTDYEGVTLYTLEAKSGDQPVIVARTGDVVVLGNDVAAVRKVIDTQAGRAAPLADQPAYQELRNLLPKERAFTVLMAGESLLGLTKALLGTLAETPYGSGGLPAVPEQTLQQYESIRAMGVSLAPVDDGVRLDMATLYDESKLTETQRKQLQTGGGDMMLPWLPDKTLLYAAGNHFDVAWDVYREALVAQVGEEGFSEVMDSFEQAAGFRAEDLFAVLNGGYAMAVLPDEGGLIGGLSGTEGPTLGFAILAETSDENAVLNMLDQLNERLTGMGGDVEIKTQELAGVEAYTLGSSYGRTPYLVYGVGKGHLALTTSTGLFTDIHDGGATVADAEAYKFVTARFPKDMSMSLYVDVRGTIELLKTLPGFAGEAYEEEAGVYVAPFKALAMGNRYATGVGQSAIIVYVEKPAP